MLRWHAPLYRIAGYFRGVLIFVIFVANPGVTKFSTHEIFTRTLVQVCEHQPSSCFVDVVASHARLDTEALHLSSSLAYPDAYRQESGYALLVETKIRIACTPRVQSSHYVMREKV